MPDIMFPRAPGAVYPIGTNRTTDAEMNDGVREQIARTLREFGFTPIRGVLGCTRNLTLSISTEYLIHGV
jgi:hypothetical protein